MRYSLSAVTAGVFLVASGLEPVWGQDQKVEGQVRTATEQFVKEFKAKEWGKLSNRIGNPWYHNRTEKIIFDEENTLKSLKATREEYDKDAELLKAPWEAYEVLPYEKTRDRVQKRLKNPKNIQALDALFSENHWVVVLTVKEKEKVREVGFLVIRAKGEKVHVVGLLD